ncbi:MAG: type II toxin-antitoxin system VapC family toxin [Betaproteobacteria bacterium]|nr:type II toxin-antitoxin system VapC family toxin [Betaproteobacteria bacterium]
MSLLLDTHVALWWLAGSTRLKRKLREQIATSNCAISVACIWEIAIKHRLGKLAVSPQIFRDEMRNAGAAIISISDIHAIALGSLPEGHGDPFDLLLLATARVEGMRLVTADTTLLAYARDVGGISVASA